MQKKKAVAVLVILAMIISASLGYFLSLPSTPDADDEEQNLEIDLHPYNSLNWWNIAWEEGKFNQFSTPLTTIVSKGSRFGESDGYEAAADYLIDTLESLSIEASFWGEHRSVVGYQKGYGNDSRAIVFGAHLDSAEDSSGVDQNAGGCATVMMIATVLSEFQLPVDLYYCFFAGNMEFIDFQKNKRALYGSQEVADTLKTRGVDVISSLNFDEILYYDSQQSENKRLIVEYRSPSIFGYHQTAYFADLLITFMSSSGYDIINSTRNTQTDTDHKSFWERGYPAINIKSGHTKLSEDYIPDSLSTSYYNKTQGFLVAKASCAMAVYLAQKGNGNPTEYKLQRELDSYEQATLHTIITVPQQLQVYGNVEVPENTSLTLRNASFDLLSIDELPNSSFSFETEMPALIGDVRLSVRNVGDTNNEIEVYLVYDSDTDGDGILDSDQYSWPPPQSPLDWDNDGLNESLEKSIGCDPFVSDTDGDGMNDGYEVNFGLDPLADDAEDDLDNDGLSNIREKSLGTRPNHNDTDEDNLPDNWEVTFGTDPLVNDSHLDFDDDNLTNYEEYLYGSDPLSADSDFDGLTDWEEVQLGTDPSNDDTDADDLNDLSEIRETLDPLFPDYDMDLLPDGSDPNPRINSIIVILMLALVPVATGSIIFWKRLG
ncbi:MAG: M28 family peptidase [Candidatus Thorarchaeota archaeon]